MGHSEESIQLYDHLDLDTWIRVKLREKKYTFKFLCNKIGMTQNGLKASLQNRTIKFMTIIDISFAIGVPLTELLKYGSPREFVEYSESRTKEKDYKEKEMLEKIVMLQQALIEQNSIIGDLKESMEELKSKKND